MNQQQGSDVRDVRVVVCVGPGGVGKTTTAAALGIALATKGQRVAVVTVDPARRLADALGIDALTNKPRPIPLPRTIPGSLCALMLDTANTFDELVRRYAVNSLQADTILTNNFYRNISRSLSGTQEYMAMEKLYELVREPRNDVGEPIDPFDVVIVDTPPTKNGLDLISASDRLIRLLDNRIFRALMASPKSSFRLIGSAAQLALKPLGRIIGTDVLDDAIAFFQEFEGMEDGFRARATQARELFTGSASRWVLVTGPQQATVRESVELAQELANREINLCGTVANRVQPLFDVPAISAYETSTRVRAAAQRAIEANQLAVAQRAVLAPLVALAPAITYVGLKQSDVHTLAHLRTFAAQFADPDTDPDTDPATDQATDQAQFSVATLLR